MALLQAEERERDQDQPEGDVEPEDPLPGDALHDRAADQRAERDGEAADPAPGAEREAAALGRHGRGEDRQGQRQHDRAAEALDRAGRDQLVRRAGASAAIAEAPVKIGEPDHEQTAPAEAVAERGAGEEQHREGERVGVDRPLEPLQARVRGRGGSPAAPS